MVRPSNEKCQCWQGLVLITRNGFQNGLVTLKVCQCDRATPDHCHVFGPTWTNSGYLWKEIDRNESRPSFSLLYLMQKFDLLVLVILNWLSSMKIYLSRTKYTNCRSDTQNHQGTIKCAASEFGWRYTLIDESNMEEIDEDLPGSNDETDWRKDWGKRLTQ